MINNQLTFKQQIITFFIRENKSIIKKRDLPLIKERWEMHLYELITDDCISQREYNEWLDEF